MINDELTGILVLVAPERTDEPRHGQVGMITGADTDRNEIYVGFGKGELALYGAEALMMLKKPSVIYQDMLRNATNMEVNDFKELFRVSMLLDSGLTKDRRRAIEMVRDNPAIREYSMAPLDEQIGANYAQSYGR